VTLDSLTDAERREKLQLLDTALEHSEQGQWAEAADTNQAILALDPEDVTALNRLGQSLTKLGKLREAYEAYSKAVEIDPANAIALRNSARLREMLDNLQADVVEPADPAELRAENFIMETGRSLVLPVEDLGTTRDIATILPGDSLELRPEGPFLRLYTQAGGLVGAVPPERAHRLLELLAAGNKYSAVVATVSVQGVDVLIRESYRSPETYGKLPFPAVSRQTPEARVGAREAPVEPSAEEYADEPDVDTDSDEPAESQTESLVETDDSDDSDEE
jgi:tetratricopeptide (TPR) repeat protein